MKSVWTAACLAFCAAAICAYCSGCAAAKSSINEFNRMEVGGGPGASLIHLTELQKQGAGKRSTASSNQAIVPAASVPERNADSSAPPDSNRTVPQDPAPGPTATPADPPGNTKNTSPSFSVPAVVRAPPPIPGFPKENTGTTPATPAAVGSPSGGSASSVVFSSKVPATTLPPPSNAAPPQVSHQVHPDITGASGEDYSGGPRYRIGPEDVIRISVWENKELTLDVMVRPDGKISVPLIQDVQAEGLTAGELADVIEKKLVSYIKDPHVSIIVLQVNASKFYVVGYVKNPGTYPLRGNVSILQALSLAGGFTEFASPRRIKLVRKSGNMQEVRVINYYDVIDRGGEGNLLLRPGDTIVVP